MTDWHKRNRERIRASARRRYAESATVREKRKAESRRNHLRRSYGIDAKAFDEMLANQNNVCAACGGVRGRFVVDHDHRTGVVRGILCLQCNTALGQVDDSADRLHKLVEYLSK